MKTENKNAIKTDKRLIDFANYAKLFDWHFDNTGYYCYTCKGKIFSVFINNCDNTMDISVDFIEDNINITWETHNDFEEMLKAIHRLLAKYAFN